MQNKIWQLTNLCLITSGAIIGLETLQSASANAATLWSTLSPNSAQAFTSQPNAAIGSETADDFFFLNSLAPQFEVEGIKVDGLFSDPDAEITNVRVELYRSFPVDSDATRTTDIVRLNGPADDAFAAFDSAEGSLSYSVKDKGSFTVDSTITPGSLTNLGAVGSGLTGNLRQIDITLTDSILLDAAATPLDQANHYFLAATVETSQGDYYWLAGEQPPTTVGDRQAWLRTEPFVPDWIRVSDIINDEPGTLAPAFNASFEVSGKPVPEPSTALGTLALGSIALGLSKLRKRRAI